MFNHIRHFPHVLRKHFYDTILTRYLQMKGIATGSNLIVEPGTRLDLLQGGNFRIGASVRIGRGTRIQVFEHGDLTIGNNVTFRDNCCIECRGKMTIGEGSYFNNGSIIYCNGEIAIGSEVLLAPYVFLTDHDHATDDLNRSIIRQGFTQPRFVSIENGVWLGVKATINKGVIVGEGAVIGANAVVTKDIPPFSVAVGIPAKVIRARNAEPKQEEQATGMRPKLLQNSLRLTLR